MPYVHLIFFFFFFLRNMYLIHCTSPQTAIIFGKKKKVGCHAMKPLANPSESRKAGEALMVDIVLNNNTFNRFSRDSPISFSKELIKLS